MRRNAAGDGAWTTILCALLVAAGTQADPVRAGDLTPRERAGKRIYQRGYTDSETPVYAWLGDPPIKISAKTLPCMNCHGFEGSGRPEGGVSPSNITWSSLTKSYGSTHPTGRRHAPYTEATLKRAIIDGIDPSGNRLGVGMPKFSMCDEDLDRLVAYLRKIEHEQAPGITERTVTVATILTVEGPRGSTGRAIRKTLEAQFAETNAAGGLYNRKILLRVVSAGPSPIAAIEQLKSMIQENGVFALIAPYAPGGEDALVALAAEREMPVIAPLGNAPNDVDGPNRFLFYLSSGLATQARVLVDVCAEQLAEVQRPRVCVVAREDAPFIDLVGIVKEQFLGHDISLRVLQPFGPDAAPSEALAKDLTHVEAVIFLSPSADCVRVLGAFSPAERGPAVYLPGAFVDGDIFDSPVAFNRRIFATFGNSRHAQSPLAVEKYEGFLRRNQLDSRATATQLGAYCAGAVFLEAVKRSGKDLRREQLIRQLEGFYKFETGLIPPLTYGPDRRVGAYGAYVVSVDLLERSLVGSNRWREPTE